MIPGSKGREASPFKSEAGKKGQEANTGISEHVAAVGHCGSIPWGSSGKQ